MTESDNYGRLLPVPEVAIHRYGEIKYVPKTDLTSYLCDGWKVVAGTPAQGAQS